jgi:hypothetical protein
MAGGSAVGVIVDSPQAALAKVQEYREDGFDEVTVKDLDGKIVEIDQLEV